MADNVTTVDFGKSKREAGDKLLRLIGAVEKQNEELRNDPVRIFNLAAKKVTSLQMFIRELEDANSVSLTPHDVNNVPRVSPIMDTIVIMRSDYDRFKRIEALLERGPRR